MHPKKKKKKGYRLKCPHELGHSSCIIRHTQASLELQFASHSFILDFTPRQSQQWLGIKPTTSRSEPEQANRCPLG